MDSIIFTLMWPQLVKKLAVWHIVGGNEPGGLAITPRMDAPTTVLNAFNR